MPLRDLPKVGNPSVRARGVEGPTDDGLERHSRRAECTLGVSVGHEGGGTRRGSVHTAPTSTRCHAAGWPKGDVGVEDALDE